MPGLQIREESDGQDSHRALSLLVEKDAFLWRHANYKASTKLQLPTASFTPAVHTNKQIVQLHTTGQLQFVHTDAAETPFFNRKRKPKHHKDTSPILLFLLQSRSGER
ncbi:hypothetical protein NQZ68_010745 [Dissostichus eleginoides]|nr:hypothetical protein NQZ68_010745 [Dissostichus eleginoides]